jgi:hypothetical protein
MGLDADGATQTDTDGCEDKGFNHEPVHAYCGTRCLALSEREGEARQRMGKGKRGCGGNEGGKGGLVKVTCRICSA